MEFLNQRNCIKTLTKLCASCNKTTIVIIRGHKGIGKSFCLSKFLKADNQVITFHSTGLELSNLQMIENTLIKYSRNKMVTYDHFKDDGLTYDEKLLSWMFEVVSENNHIFYFENINTWNLSVLSFMQQFVSLLTNEYDSYKTILLLELNDDDDGYLKMQDAFEDFYATPPYIKWINFQQINRQELKEYFPLLLDGEKKISEKQMDYIVDAASGNILLLKRIINYLQQIEYIVCDDNNVWTCHDISTEVLLEAVKKSIQSRYNKLEDSLKETIKISALLGLEINPDILEKSFQLIDVQDKLELIEKISSLLIKLQDESTSDRFKFENTEVYYYIQNKLSNDEKMRWCQTLLKYYHTQRIKLLKEKKHSLHTDYDLNSLEISMLQVGYIGGCLEDVLRILMSLTTRCINILNFKQALDILEKYKYVYDCVNIDSSIQCYFLTQKAYCQESLGQYENAKKTYEECIEKYDIKSLSFVKEYYQYKIAFCTYYMSDVNDAFSLVNDVYNTLQVKGQINLLYFQTVSLLATLYKEKGDYDNALSFFNTALSCCKKNGYEEEYYVQLRKSCLIIEMHLAIPMLLQSVDYFEKKQNIKELAKAYHNLGSNYLYTNKKELSFTMLNNARDKFKSFGSNDIVVPINNLGIWYAMYENDIQKALKFFSKALTYNLNHYKKLTILSNIAICHLLQQDDDNFFVILNKIKDNSGISVNTAIPYYQTVSELLIALYDYHNANFFEAAKRFKNILDSRVTNRQRFLLSNFIIDISQKISVSLSSEVKLWKNIKPNYLFQLYYRKKIMFRTLRFVE